MAGFTQAEVDAAGRLAAYYNGTAYNQVSNPGGMASGGHRVNFINSLKDESAVGLAVGRVANEAAASASLALGYYQLAAQSAAFAGAVIDQPDVVTKTGYAASMDFRFSSPEAILTAWFSRASTGTYLDKTGALRTAIANSIRIDTQNGVCRGAALFASKTNLLPRSQEMDLGPWANSAATVVANAAVAPDGTTTMTKVVESVNGGVSAHHKRVQNFTYSAQTYTLSCFAKAGERQWIILFCNDGVQTRGAFFDVLNGVVGNTQGGSVSNPRITKLPGGIFRCEVTVTTGAGAGELAAAVTSANGTFSYVGDGTSGAYFWGYQLEAQGTASTAAASPYVPTAGSTAASAADILSISGSDFSEGFNPSEGTIIVDFVLDAIPGSGQFPTILSLNDGTANNNLLVAINPGGALSCYVAVAGVGQAFLSLGTTTVGQKYRAAFSYATNAFYASVNGSSAVGDTVGSLPTVNRMQIGHLLNSQQMNGCISRLAYVPKAIGPAVAAVSAL